MAQKKASPRTRSPKRKKVISLPQPRGGARNPATRSRTPAPRQQPDRGGESRLLGRPASEEDHLEAQCSFQFQSLDPLGQEALDNQVDEGVRDSQPASMNMGPPAHPHQ